MTDEEDRMDALLRQMAAEEYNRPPHIVPREQMWDAVISGIGNDPSLTLKTSREAGIAGKRDEGSGNRDSSVVPIRRRVPQWVIYAVAAVALLAVGIQFGRMMESTGKGQQQMAPIPDSLGRDSAGLLVPSPDREVVANERSDDGKGRPRPRPEPERFANPNVADDASTQAYSVVASQHLTQVEALLTAFKSDLSQGRMDAEMALWGKDLLSNTRLLIASPVGRDPVRRKLLQDLELVLVQIVQLSPNAPAVERDLINGAITEDQVLTRLRTAIPLQKGT